MSSPTPEELKAYVAKHYAVLERLAADPVAIQIDISKADAILLHGELQLALRHPANNGAAAVVARAVCTAICTAFANDPQATEILLFNNDPAMDQPATPPAPAAEPETAPVFEMRDSRQIQAAHDLLSIVLNNDTPLELNTAERSELFPALAALCWVLKHSHGDFGNNVQVIKNRLQNMGVKLGKVSPG